MEDPIKETSVFQDTELKIKNIYLHIKHVLFYM